MEAIKLSVAPLTFENSLWAMSSGSSSRCAFLRKLRLSAQLVFACRSVSAHCVWRACMHADTACALTIAVA